MNQTFSLTIDVPNGYEATGEYRQPCDGDTYLTTVGTPATCLPGGAIERFDAFILRRAWTPPAWLPVDNWLYNNSEQWRITNREPRVLPGNQYPRAASGAVTIDMRTLAVMFGQDFTPPPEYCNTRVYRL